MTYTEAIDWLFSLHRFGMKLGLENIRTLTELLGRPQDRFPSALVAGTNGKGSTAAMLQAILGAAGIRAGLYTSPHLVRTEERIRIGDAEIAEADLTAILNELRTRIDWLLATKKIGAHPTFFEVITTASFVAFARAGVEAAVLEVGLGGRLDATNVVEPVLSVITSIDLDHQEQLGTTLTAIAREKAGILRSGVPVVVGAIEGPPLATIREQARLVGAPLTLASDGSRISGLRSTDPLSPPHFSIATPVREYPRLHCPLAGAHQRLNALIAIRAAELFPRLPRAVDARAIADGIGTVRWPGRLEWVEGRPPMLLDGAHNPAGCRALAEHLGSFVSRPVLLFAAMRDKDVDLMLQILIPRAASAVFTRLPMERATDPEELLAAARGIAKGLTMGAMETMDVMAADGETPSATHPGEGALLKQRAGGAEPPRGSGEPAFVADPDVASALAKAKQLAGPGGMVLVCGSLFLVGAVKEVLLGLPVRAGEVR